MAWIAKLDARSATWWTPARWLYLAMKWSLATLGAYLSVVLCIEELRQQRVSLGTGITIVLLYRLIALSVRTLSRLTLTPEPPSRPPAEAPRP